jgi:hypothetical protein
MALRNKLTVVRQFFEEKHRGCYMIFNCKSVSHAHVLASESTPLGPRVSLLHGQTFVLTAILACGQCARRKPTTSPSWAGTWSGCRFLIITLPRSDRSRPSVARSVRVRFVHSCACVGSCGACARVMSLSSCACVCMCACLCRSMSLLHL